MTLKPQKTHPQVHQHLELLHLYQVYLDRENPTLMLAIAASYPLKELLKLFIT
ncbi:hypothetical protein NEA10_14835 [Phormidium yuhuli AB48]|uniref:Uncharacterized protein n=1 Tax=Phormidium yuhuli AB48 TaxID=2940671 RepID=A0ABY5AVI2_9CYAN|nr:hypothetical protein [Phormidium yuhuli]USR93244.1 hypothetical protein NEA10_14835 [Phormidium yuhuli AB48]